MDKNTVVGFILIALVLIGFSILNKPSEEEIQKQKERQSRDSVEYAQTQEQSLLEKDEVLIDGLAVEEKKHKNFFDEPKQDSSSVVAVDSERVIVNEDIYTLENSKLKIEISSKGGQLVSVQIKDYKRYDQDSLYLFNRDAHMDLVLTNKNYQELRTGSLDFELIDTKDSGSLIMRHEFAKNQHVDFVYKLSEDDYMLNFDVSLVGLQDAISRESVEFLQLELSQQMRRLETNKKNEQRYSSLYYKYVGDDVKELDAGKGESVEVTEPMKWIAFKNQFFASVLIADDKIAIAQLDSKILESEQYIKSMRATIYSPVSFGGKAGSLKSKFTYYFGPMSYSLLKQYDDNVKEASKELTLDELVPLGWSFFRWVNKYFVIPLFNLLKSTGLGIGLVILLLTIIVKLIVSPLTYKSFISSAKMRVLRPQVEEINARFPKQEQAQEKQQAVMSLYSRAGASPMSGCMPMLMQMPLLIALFQFFPNNIDLRHQGFLWADDLSTYDALWTLPESIPLIGGIHLSLFCILMTITNVVYAKFNMESTNTGQQQMPGMKWMMYLMPFFLFFVLNDYPSGLTYYYFISLLITILLTLTFRFIVDEDKLLAKLEANKAKPKKKSGFMARLEEAQRMQQKKLQEEQKKNKRKK